MKNPPWLKFFLAQFIIIGTMLWFSAHSVSGGESSPSYYFLRSWGAEGSQFRDPRGIKIGPANAIYVADRALDRVVKIVPPENNIFTIGNFGPNSGEFNNPNKLTIDSNGFLYIIDDGPTTDSVFKFSSDGNNIAWPTNSDDCSFNNGLSNIAVDSNNIIYIAETANQSILRIADDGTCLTPLSGAENGGTKFVDLVDIFVDNTNKLYVLDQGGNRFHIINGSSSVLIPSLPEQSYENIAVAGQGATRRVFLSKDSKIDATDVLGNLLSDWNNECSENQYFDDIEDLDSKIIGLTNQYYIFVLDRGANKIVLCDEFGKYLTEWGQPSVFHNPSLMTIDNQNNIYVLNQQKNELLKFNSDGLLQPGWPTNIDGCAGASVPNQVCGIAIGQIGSDKVLYVVETLNNQVSTYTLDGNKYNVSFGSSGSGNGFFDEPRGITIDDDGNVFVVDAGNNRVQKFTSNGTYVTQWGEIGSNNNQFNNPIDIVTDSQGNVYVVDAGNYRVQIFDNDGTWLRQCGTQGNVLGAFGQPFGIGIDENDNFYVSDHDLNSTRIQQMNLDVGVGTNCALVQWGTAGGGSSRFELPADIVVDNNGLVYVTDMYEHLVQVFSPQPPSTSICNGSFEENPPLNCWSYSGSLPVSKSDSDSYLGDYALLLGEKNVPIVPQGPGDAWAHQTIYVDPAMIRPMLSFRYHILTNDTIDYSDFIVTVEDAVGLNHIDTIVRDGYLACPRTQPPSQPGTSLTWQQRTYDLSELKGETIRVRFSIRNLHAESFGIWAYIDDVRIEEGLVLGANKLYLPLILNQYEPCNEFMAIPLRPQPLLWIP